VAETASPSSTTWRRRQASQAVIPIDVASATSKPTHAVLQAPPDSVGGSVNDR
jgi:hypothetical protein